MARNWIICHDATRGLDAYAVECLRCGAKQRFAMPMDLDLYLAAAREFQRKHAKCEELEGRKVQDVEATGKTKAW